MAANTNVESLKTIEDSPPPVLKKRATKRGLSKLASAVPEDPPDVQTHNTHVYSSCVQRSIFSLSSQPRKPLFSKQSDNTDKAPVSDSDVTAVREKRARTCQALTASTTLEEPSDSAVELVDDLDEDENSIQTTEDVSIIRSPSPPVPPPPPTRLRPKRTRISKGIQNAFKAINSIKGELQKVNMMSPQSPAVVVDSPEHTYTQLVRVRHIDDVHRFSMSKTEMFYSLQTQMATLLGVRGDQIGLYLNDSRLAASDTPLSTRLHLADIIVCHILVSKEGESEEEEEGGCTDNIRIQMQYQNSRRKSRMTIKKYLPFKVMMEKYAQKKGKPLEKFQFLFDGEQLLPDMLPSDVDLDDDDTIDVVEMK
ncbi:NFATC2-interacting protein-like [Babylonia areolata]|uniref:NFATC2-interacting protein-like n=1 Tax=Babylonia areolata TaxID=304850 RepID=UPI003FD66589